MFEKIIVFDISAHCSFLYVSQSIFLALMLFMLPVMASKRRGSWHRNKLKAYTRVLEPLGLINGSDQKPMGQAPAKQRSSVVSLVPAGRRA